jgi:hypothetical protein
MTSLEMGRAQTPIGIRALSRSFEKRPVKVREVATTPIIELMR